MDTFWSKIEIFWPKMDNFWPKMDYFWPKMTISDQKWIHFDQIFTSLEPLQRSPLARFWDVCWYVSGTFLVRFLVRLCAFLKNFWYVYATFLVRSWYVSGTFSGARNKIKINWKFWPKSRKTHFFILKRLENVPGTYQERARKRARNVPEKVSENVLETYQKRARNVPENVPEK